MSRRWDWSKAFDQSAPCGPLTPVSEIGHLSSGRIWLSVNGEIRQDADLSELIWPIADVISICSRSVRLRPGDLIYTGTPAGVGTLQPGDKVEGGVDGLGTITIQIAPPEEKP